MGQGKRPPTRLYLQPSAKTHSGTIPPRTRGKDRQVRTLERQSQAHERQSGEGVQRHRKVGADGRSSEGRGSERRDRGLLERGWAAAHGMVPFYDPSERSPG